MPKEFISSRWFGETAQVVDPDTLEPAYRAVIEDTKLKVGWTREGEQVELAVVHADPKTGEPDEMEAVHMQLDRSGINRIIRILRRARDAAFGADA